MTVRDFWIFGEVVCEESRTMTQCCSGSAQRDFLKGELRHARKGPCAPLPCQQREKIEDVVCSYRVQLGGQIRKVHSKGISRPQPGANGRADAAHSGKLGTMSAAMAVGWELDRQELSTLKQTANLAETTHYWKYSGTDQDR